MPDTQCGQLGGCPTTLTSMFFSSSSGVSGMPSLITNADQGVLLSFLAIEGSYSQTTDVYCAAPGCPNEIPYELTSSNSSYSNGASNSYLATIASGGGVSLATLNLPGQNAPIQPVLQRADGSYVGTAYVNEGNELMMMAFTASGQQLWSVPNDTPQIATSDDGVIGASGTTYDQNGSIDGQEANNSAVTSWSSNWYLASGGVTALALPLVDELDSTSNWGFAGGNPSQNGTSFLQCCTPGPEWLFGVATGTSSDPPPVSKPYPLNNISCTKSPSQVISDMEANFGSFADYDGAFGPFGIPGAWGSVTFTGIVSLDATINIHNVNTVTVPNAVGPGGQVVTKEFNVAVQVSQVSPSSFTFTTLPGHVLYPATISFTASSSGAGYLNFVIDVNGSFANLGSAIGYYAGGSNLENHIWNHVLQQVQADCKP
jgi:hypothetical protein